MKMMNFEEGLGRAMYVAGALEHDAVPPYAKPVQSSRHCVCALEMKPSAMTPSVEAQTSVERTGTGGWLPVLRPDEFLEVTRDSWQWVYEKQDQPALGVSTLEAIVVLFSLQVLFGDDTEPHKTRVVGGFHMDRQKTNRLSTEQSDDDGVSPQPRI